MRKLLKALLETDEHGDSPLSLLVFCIVFVGMMLALASMPGW